MSSEAHSNIRLLLDAWRQRRHPVEFRISTYDAEPIPAPVPETLQVGPAPDPRATDPTPELPDNVLVEIATELWRGRRKASLSGEGGGERHFERAWDDLEQAGIEIFGHDSQPYHRGMDIEVVAFEADPAVTRPTITSTIRPTVRRNLRKLQVAQVIVGTPADETTAASQGADR